MKKRVLVTFARYGSGHKTMAEYVAKYIEENNKNVDVKLLDITPYGNVIGKISVKIMDHVCRKRSELLFNTFYELLDNKFFSFGHNNFSKRCYDNATLRKIISSFRPDITISTHFYCSNLITYYNDLKLINSKLFTIITDYHTHEIWTKNHEKETGFIVGNKLVKDELIAAGIDRKKIYDYGLPLNISDISKLDKEEDIKNRYHINNDNKTYLFFGGSTAGSMYYYDYFKAICNLHIDKNIIFISGKNEKLRNKCISYVKENNIKNVNVQGFSTDVFNLMKISDLVISKAGGATVTESMEMKVPMLLIPGVGGQEKHNASFMVKKRYGLTAKNKRQFKKLLIKIENNPKILKRMELELQKQESNNSVMLINNLIKRV